MRVTQAVKFVAVVGILSCMVTFILRSTCGSCFTHDGLGEDKAGYGSETRFMKAQNPMIGAGSLAYNSSSSNQDHKMVVNLYRAIDCNINSERSLKCRREGDEVYLPFSFIKDYFEVYGDVKETDGYERLEFHHSNSIVHPPRSTYSPGSVFMAFDHFNVENRSRVKCVTASEGVPLTVQWKREGYHYVIQIAQYGLSHHAKYILGERPEQVVVEDGKQSNLSSWVMPDRRSLIRPATEEGNGRQVLEFLTSDSLRTKGITRIIDEDVHSCIILNVKFATNGSVTVIVRTSSGNVKIHYVFSNSDVSYDGKSSIFYGLGERRNEWIHLARDLRTDLLKGLLVKLKGGSLGAFEMMGVVGVRLHGHGWVDNITLVESVHADQFYDAANWLIRHQDERGGWPIMVPRRLVPGVMELPPGWYSAMGQGQAVSLLVRAYLDSKNFKYLNSAVDAMKLFEIDSDQGGVRARFLGSLDWYEEYPTIPSSFVLNGFIYSLLGLYDLKETASGESKSQAERLYASGMKSLKAMIGLFDTGAGTFYDLRHITSGLEPNRARWDYHTAHINQLLQLMVVDDDEVFKTFSQRWMGYLKGKKAQHN